MIVNASSIFKFDYVDCGNSIGNISFLHEAITTRDIYYSLLYLLTQVTIVSEDFSPNLTSDGSGGVWEPYDNYNTDADKIRFDRLYNIWLSVTVYILTDGYIWKFLMYNIICCNSKTSKYFYIMSVEQIVTNHSGKLNIEKC